MQEHEFEWRINKTFLFQTNMDQRKTYFNQGWRNQSCCLLFTLMIITSQDCYEDKIRYSIRSKCSEFYQKHKKYDRYFSLDLTPSGQGTCLLHLSFPMPIIQQILNKDLRNEQVLGVSGTCQKRKHLKIKTLYLQPEEEVMGKMQEARQGR